MEAVGILKIMEFITKFLSIPIRRITCRFRVAPEETKLRLFGILKEVSDLNEMKRVKETRTSRAIRFGIEVSDASERDA